jgi:glutathione peroxidase
MSRQIAAQIVSALAGLLTAILPDAGRAEDMPAFTFPSIDGGVLDMQDWRGSPVLVINTASLCGFAGQLRDMQTMHEEFGPEGLVVLAVPSNDFDQELDSGKQVKEYCTLEYGITLPKTDILPVAKGEVHPFYSWVRRETGVVPRWNFHKVLLGPEGQILGTWGATVTPDSRVIHAAFAPYLGG